MSTRLQIRRNTAAGTSPSSTSLEEGELGVNTADGNLWVGQAGAAPVVPLVSSLRQLQHDATYTDGALPNLPTFGAAGAAKIFTSGVLGFESSPGGQQLTFPVADGTPAQVLALNSTGTAIEDVFKQVLDQVRNTILTV